MESPTRAPFEAYPNPQSANRWHFTRSTKLTSSDFTSIAAPSLQSLTKLPKLDCLQLLCEVKRGRPLESLPEVNTRKQCKVQSCFGPCGCLELCCRLRPAH
eukprot:5793874-Amphidinium_carterae.1